jgi:hypothetical protein
VPNASRQWNLHQNQGGQRSHWFILTWLACLSVTGAVGMQFLLKEET